MNTKLTALSRIMRGAVCGAVTILTLGATACDRSTPTEPTRPDVSGVWGGSYEVTACVAVDSCAPSPCRFLVGQRSTLRLELEQRQSRIDGHLEILIGDPFSRWVGDIDGSVDAAGGLRLSGTIPQIDRQSGRIDRYFDVEWLTTLDNGGPSMAGEFSYLARPASGTGCSVRSTATTGALTHTP